VARVHQRHFGIAGQPRNTNTSSAAQQEQSP
jgi:hypothetical protein